MIDLPADFHLTGFDIIDTNGDHWRVTDTPGETPVLSSGERYILLARTGDGEAMPFHKGLNIFHHGFDCDGAHITIDSVEKNENYNPPPVIDPEQGPSPDPDAIAAKERAFAAMLAHYAAAFQIDLTTLPDINIGAMLAAAQQAGVSPEAIADASAILMALFNDVVVESGGTSGKAWEGLKERLPGYLGELVQ